MDVTCKSCKTTLEIEENEVLQKSFICPSCGVQNKFFFRPDDWIILKKKLTILILIMSAAALIWLFGLDEELNLMALGAAILIPVTLVVQVLLLSLILLSIIWLITLTKFKFRFVDVVVWSYWITIIFLIMFAFTRLMRLFFPDYFEGYDY